MYRLLEENRNIERRSVISANTTSKRLLTQPAPNKSPPRRPYDELQMDQRQQERLSQRSKRFEGESLRQVQQQNSGCMDISNHSTGSAKERLRSRMDLDNSNCSTSSTGSRHPPLDRRRGRKSHPWQTDVKINRFSSNTATPSGRPPLAGTSRTQQSTLGWKQRMQERRAVFGNVAVPEQSFDDDDGLLDDDEDDESRGEKDEEQIREEAVELLKSKGFHNFQGILEHHYEDDLESVGGSVKSVGRAGSIFVSPPAATTTVRQHTIQLGEIQSLRQKILLQQNLSDSTLPEDEEEQPFEQQVQDLLHIGTTRSVKRSTTAPPPEVIPLPEDNGDAIKAWRVMKQLKVRLLDVFRGDHVIVEAMGCKGVGSPSQTNFVIDENAFARHKLRDAVEKRVSQVFTGDHHIVINGEIQVSELDEDQCSLIAESLSGDSPYTSPKSQSSDEEGKENSEEDAENHKSPELRDRLSDSFFVFEAMMRARQQAAADRADEPTIRNQANMLPSMPLTTHAEGDDDQSCYSEYTVDTTAFQTGIRQSIVSTATAVNGEIYMDDSRKTIKADNTHAAKLASQLGGGEYSTPGTFDDDTSYAEYTVQEDFPAPMMAAPPPFRMPGQAPLPVQTRRNEPSDDQSYMEFTVQESDTHPAKQNPPSDDQSYMDFTVQEAGDSPRDSPPTRLPPQRKDPSAEDSAYEEITVADQGPNTCAIMSPDLASPHLTSMLSSRMFADMQLPPELQQQQQSGVAVDNHGSYPTITCNQDDDDMTQITFDQTMVEDVRSPAQEHHQHAVQYLKASTKSNETFRSCFNKEAPPHRSLLVNNVDVTSVVGSQHTDQTRDTTVSDDASSHQDVASFKSCISTESSQFVADLLRRDIWSQEAAVVQAALEKLEQEAMKGFHERSNIVRYGGLLAMLRAMEMKPDKPQIQIAAFSALEKLSQDASTQVAIGEVGGIPAIANAMKVHSENVNVQQAACKTLSCLTRRRDGGCLLSLDPIPAEGIVEAVTKTMAQHPDDAEIQAYAFGTLANLCLDNQARLHELKKNGGLAAMTLALQVPWANQTDQHEAISTLSILLRSMTLLDKS